LPAAGGDETRAGFSVCNKTRKPALRALNYDREAPGKR